MVSYSPWDIAAAQAIIAPLAAREGAMLPILHALQDEFGYIDAEAVALIADALNLSRAEVHGTVSFYHDFRREPAGRKVVKLCRAEACQAVGSERLVGYLQRHGLALDTTTADGELTLESVYCLGNCALGPSALVDGELIGRLDETRLGALCGCRAGAGENA